MLRVMTFNIRFGTADDGPNAWDHRKAFLVDTIRGFRPDLLATQECLDFQIAYLAGALPDYRWLGIGREADGGGEIAALFYRADALVPVRTGSFWLSETPDAPGSRSWDSACTRMATWARFYLPARNIYVHGLNTHFDHHSENARENAATVLMESLNSVPEAVPAVVMGDFNAIAGHSKAWDLLANGRLKDAWLAAEERIGPETTFHAFQGIGRERGHRIDWILTDRRIRVKRMEVSTIDRNGRFPSDHFPIIADLELPQS